MSGISPVESVLQSRPRRVKQWKQTLLPSSKRPCGTAYRDLCELGRSQMRRHSMSLAGRTGRAEQQVFASFHSERAFCRDWRITASAAEAEPLEQENVAASASGAALNKKLRIKLKSFCVEPIQRAVQLILSAANATGAQVSGPVPLPTRRRLYCVLRSPHVDKDSREHFEIRTHSRLIDIQGLSVQTIDELMALDIPAGVDANIKIM